MPSAMLATAELANCGRDAPREALHRLIEEATPEVVGFRFSPPPGAIMAVALDWQAVVGVGASLYTLADAFWHGYERFVRPRLKTGRNGQPQPFLFVSVARPGTDMERCLSSGRA